jgi:carbohydrate/starch-binding protein with CBM21 domain
VVLGTANFNGSTLTLNIGVQNLSFTKTVGIVYTTNNWATIGTAFGTFDRTMSSGLEVWDVTVAVGSAPDVQFAIFYQVLGTEYWDNNFGANYQLTPGTPQGWGGAPLN